MTTPLFLAVGHNGLRITSPDGKNWSAPVLGKEGETYRCAAGGNGCLATIGSFGGSNIFAATADGSTWKTSIKDAQYSRYIRGLGFGNGTFLALGGDPGSVGLARPFTLTSIDGEKWDETACPKVDLPDRVTVGVYLWHDVDQPCEAVFERFKLTPLKAEK